MIEISEFLDLSGLRLLTVTNNDILVTSESVDELKEWDTKFDAFLLNGFQLHSL